MTAKDFVKLSYPNADSFPMIDNRNMQTSYVIRKYGNLQLWMADGLEIFENKAAKRASKAWSNAKKEIQRKGR